MPDTIARTDTVKGALNAFAASAGPQLSSLVDAERREIERTRAAARTLSERLQWGAAAAAVLAILLMVALHRRITGPLVGRIAEIEAGRAAVGRGQLEIRIAGGGRDELGLLVAQFNRMAARLARRERRVVTDRAALERTIADRNRGPPGRQCPPDDRRRPAPPLLRRRQPRTAHAAHRDPRRMRRRLRGLAKEDGPLRAAFLTIRGRAQRLHRRVGDMLRVARSASGEIELDREGDLAQRRARRGDRRLRETCGAPRHRADARARADRPDRSRRSRMAPAGGRGADRQCLRARQRRDPDRTAW